VVIKDRHAYLSWSQKTISASHNDDDDDDDDEKKRKKTTGAEIGAAIVRPTKIDI